MTEIRQQNLRSLETASFSSSHAREDTAAFKDAVYEEAERLGVLSVIALTADLATYGLDREDTRAMPAPPAAGANAAAHKTYEIEVKLYLIQSAALRNLKHKVVQSLDATSKKIIDEPTHGVLHRTVIDILTLLMAEYGSMTLREAAEYKDDWAALRWDGATDLSEFIANFMEKVNLMTSHGNPPSAGEQITTLQRAVAHVPAFATMANQQYFNEAPTLNLQTMPTLITVYRRVHRGQYINSTAVQHNMLANQVMVTTTHDNMAASARSDDISPALQSAIAKAVAQAMNPRDTKRTDKPKTTWVKPQVLAAGVCPLHPNLPTPHLWAQCNLNPAKK